jgi:hypothetical protein
MPRRRSGLAAIPICSGIAIGVLASGLCLRSLLPVASQSYMPPESVSDPILRSARLNLPGPFTLADLVNELHRATGVPVRPRWDIVDRNGINRTQRIDVPLTDIPIADALRITSDALQLTGSRRLDARILSGSIELAESAAFDRMELTETMYDLGHYARARANACSSPFTLAHEAQSAVEEVMCLITATVEPDTWFDNGGDLATVRRVDYKLIISAPPRMHHHIRWLIDSLPTNLIRERPDRRGHHGCFG